MKFSATNQSCLRGITAVQNACGSPMSNDLVQNIYLSCKDNTAEFIATNLNLTIRCVVEANVEEEGKIVIPSQVISNIVRDLPTGNVSVLIKNKVILMECGEFKARFNGQDADDFPPFVQVDEGYDIEIESKTLKDIIRKTIFSTTSEKARFELDGVFFDVDDGVLNFITTDGRRLTWYKHLDEKIKGGKLTALVPSKTLIEVSASIPDEGMVTIRIQEKKIQFVCGDATIVSNLLINNFPHYDKIVPIDPLFKAVVKKDDIALAVRRAANLSSEETSMVLLKFGKNKLEVLGERVELGGEGLDVIDMKYEGDEMAIRYNHKFISEFVRVIEEEELEIHLWEETKPAIFRESGNEAYLYVIMPMKPPEN